MLPNTTLGLLIFLYVLMPGFVWLHRTERRALRPRRPGALAIAEITIIGCTITFISALIVSAIGQIFAPPFLKVTEWLGATDSGNYFVQEFWWSIISISFVLVLSTIVAFFFPKIIYRKGSVNINFSSTVWYDVLGKERDNRQAKLGISLANGTSIEGYLFSYPTDQNDDQIALREPISFQSGKLKYPLQMDRVIIPKEQIVSIGVVFTDSSDEEAYSAQENDPKTTAAEGM